MFSPGRTNGAAADAGAARMGSSLANENVAGTAESGSREPAPRKETEAYEGSDKAETVSDDTGPLRLPSARCRSDGPKPYGLGPSAVKSCNNRAHVMKSDSASSSPWMIYETYWERTCIRSDLLQADPTQRAA